MTFHTALAALGALLIGSAALAQAPAGSAPPGGGTAPAQAPMGSTAPAVQSGIEKNPGLGQDKPKEQTSIAESNAVGSLGTNADQKSMPPAMEKDCARNPAECSDPLTTGATAPGMPQQSR